MIDQVLSNVVTRLNTYIGTTAPDVVLGNISLIDAFQDSVSQTLDDRVIVSVVNVEQEESLRNLPFRRTVSQPNGLPRGVEQQPEIFLNIYVLFGANKSDYGVALQRISEVVAFFQRQYVFTATDMPLLATFNLERIIFELYSMGFDELNQLWSVMGGKYIPSVLYKMRLAVIQDADETDTGVISEIRLRSGRLSPVPDEG